jgi:hypothetical protein
MYDKGIIIDDIPTMHRGKQYMIIEDIVFPFILYKKECSQLKFENLRNMKLQITIFMI